MRRILIEVWTLTNRGSGDRREQRNKGEGTKGVEEVYRRRIWEGKYMRV